MLDVDIAVVGAGPAGSATAIHMARRGHRVVLIDKATHPRDKTCGDGLTVNALRRLETLGLDPADVPSWRPLERVKVRVPDGRQAVFELPDDGLFVVAARRSDLDDALLGVARQAGVTIIEGRAVTGIDTERGGKAVRLTLGTGDVVRAPYVVAADGMWSSVRKMSGLAQPGYLGDAYAVRQYFAHTGPEARDLWVWFEQDILPGYAWSFPLTNGDANVGMGIVRGLGTASTAKIKQHWQDFLAQPYVRATLGPDAEAVGPLKAWPIPSHPGRSALTGLGGRLIFVGDAARASDSMTGEGIGQALETAELAARVVTKAGAGHPERAARAYNRAIRTGLALDDRVGHRMSGVLARSSRPSLWMSIATATPRIQRHYPRIMFEDYPRAIFLTPHRWKRGMFHGPAAYRTYQRQLNDSLPVPTPVS